MRKIPPSELIINSDGTIFHLHIKPSQLADKVILVGDPSRVDTVAALFDHIECNVQNREFHTITGTFKGSRITCISHGIGTDNIDFDGLLNFYEPHDGVMDLDFEDAFCRYVGWNKRLPRPYSVLADEELVERLGFDMVKGVTISAPGFYGPQGRYVRLKPVDEDLNRKIEAFEYGGEKIMNFEMESSALAGLGKMLGHRAVTICLIIAGRVSKEMNTDYKGSMEGLVATVLDRLVK